MNAERLLSLYDEIADAPDAIPRLRRFILDLAVRGKLVPQDPDDEPIREVLKRKKVEKHHAVDDSKPKRRTMAFESVKEGEWDVPNSWVFVSLESLAGPEGLFTDGDWVESKDQDPLGDVRLIQLADVGTGAYRNRSARFMNSATAARLNCTYLIPGDILIARMPDPLGRACVFPGDPRPCVTVVDVAVLRIEANIADRDYVVYAINSPGFGRNVEAKAAGTTRSRISRGNLSALPFPLPPLAEQQRIVAKVDELMALCDRLEAARAEREATRDRLTAASLARLNAPDPATFPDDARLVLETLPALTTRPDQIKHLRQTILNLAVRGKLVPQDPEDEPASELLKQSGVSRSNIKSLVRTQAGPLFSSDDELFDIPAKWIWTTLGEVGDWGSGSTPPRGNADFYGGGITWLKSGELNDNRRLAGSQETVTRLALTSGSFRINKPGDVLIAMYGATIGKAAILAETAVTNQAVCGCTPLAAVFNEYLYLFLLANREQFRSASEGGAQPNISKIKIVRTPFPLPPIAEQHRIVARVDELMSLCDQFEKALMHTSATRSRLLEALFAEALAPAEVRELEAII